MARPVDRETVRKILLMELRRLELERDQCKFTMDHFDDYEFIYEVPQVKELLNTKH